MGVRSSYEPGTFSWVDLATSDIEAAQRFYGGLFGWEAEDTPIPEGGTYTMFRLRGKNVAGGSTQREEERGQGIPPHWNSSVMVNDLDARAKKVEELGGTLILPPFDVMEAGRMAVAADPTGAVFSMWEPRRHFGAELVNEPGTLCWNELATKDTAKAKEFYTALFGWNSEDFDGGAYTVIRVGDKSNGGIRPQGEMEAGVPPNWLAYFAAEDCDAAAGKAGELGANVIVPPMDVPVAENSRIAVVADPQGAVFGIFSGPLDP